MTAEQRASSRTFWLRRGLVFGAAAWLTLSVASTLLLLGDAWRLGRQSDALQVQARADRMQETAWLAPAGGASQVGQRLAAVAAWNAVRLRDRQPGALLDAARPLRQHRRHPAHPPQLDQPPTLPRQPA